MSDMHGIRLRTSPIARPAGGLHCAAQLLDAWVTRRPYKRGYRQSRAMYLRNLIRPRQPELDLCVVLPTQSKGWILDAICREITQRIDGRIAYAEQLTDLPPARAYYICHYSFLMPVLANNPHVWGARRVALFTHPRDLAMSQEAMIYCLNQCTQIISMSRLFSEQLIQQGVHPSRIDTATMGADPSLFRPHHRTGKGAVGICTAFYPRKDPDRILAIIRAMPHRRFILLGRGWDTWKKYPQLAALPNLEIREAPYSEYPAFYAELDVFVAPGRVEGGPIPLLEAMMSNVVPVASGTGFAPDVVAHGKTGFVFDPEATVETICRYIDQAHDIRADVRRTVEHLTWNRFVRQIAPHLGGPTAPDLLPGTCLNVPE